MHFVLLSMLAEIFGKYSAVAERKIFFPLLLLLVIQKRNTNILLGCQKLVQQIPTITSGCGRGWQLHPSGGE